MTTVAELETALKNAKTANEKKAIRAKLRRARAAQPAPKAHHPAIKNVTFTPANVDSKAIASAWVKANSELLWSLWERWQDESEYEDLTEYAIPLRNAAPANVTVVQMSSRPWGVIIQTHGGYRFLVKVTAKSITLLLK